MPHPCVVCGRSRMNPNNREEDYMFFGFPVNYEDRCKKWLEFCCREDVYKLTKKQLLQRMVCSKHFEKKDFLNEYQDRLNCNGVPSIYEPSQSLYNITCVLCGKFRKDPPSDGGHDGTTFHHFPGEEFRCLKWLDFVGIDSYYRLTRKEILYCYICSNHFDESQFMPGFRARLCDNAVPTIRHPPDRPREIDYETKFDKSCSSKIFQPVEKGKKYEPLTTDVLESQACAACGRSRSDPRNKIEKYKFHPFPAYEIGRCLRWCQFLGREDLLKMSPNQIRKLVLCSKHFLTGQNFHKVGPCDAVPTIREIIDPSALIRLKRDNEIEQYSNDEDDYEVNLPMGQIVQRPMVSSKKPKIDNKPTPLAKKRGRSKRPTSINIPKIDNLNIENCTRKIAIPATNWKVQFSNNQFQSLTLANANCANAAITTDGKKVILPFTGNISNLGAPIPVNSLSSIPPGFLIKINLPEQTQQGQNIKPGRPMAKQSRRKRVETRQVSSGEVINEEEPVRRGRTKKIIIDDASDYQKIDYLYSPVNENDEQISQQSYEDNIMEEAEEVEPDSVQVLDGDYDDPDDTYNIRDEENDVHVYQEVPTTELESIEEGEIPTKGIKQKKRSVMSAKSRRTILPIRLEIRRFLHKLKPLISRLPRKAKAQLKLSIVNLVIDRL